MNRNWTRTTTGTTTRDYTDPTGPLPTVTATINRAEGRIWWNIATTDHANRDRRGTARRTVIASGDLPDTPYAMPVVKGRLTRLARAAAHLERENATAAALAALDEAIALAGNIPVAEAPTRHLRECAWQRDLAAARVEKLRAAA